MADADASGAPAPTAMETAQPPACSACVNCGAPLSGAYCAACGQKADIPTTLIALGQEFIEKVAHLDGRLWRTLPLLAFNPGRLTREYVEGCRTRYVSPLALFLFVLFATFFVFSMGGPNGADAPIVITERAEPAESADAPAPQDGQTATADADAEPSGAGLSGEAEIDVGPFRERVERALDQPELLVYRLQDAAYTLSFLLIPLSLPWLWVLFCTRRDVTLYQHTVFITYSLSFMGLLFMAVALFGRIPGAGSLISLLLILVPPVHIAAQLKGAYGLGMTGAVLRAIVISVAAGLTFFLYLAGIFAVGLWG